VPVFAIARQTELLAYTGQRAELAAHREALLAYRARYGIAD
jgi:orotate phosphoribosyltransferase